jgi:hypothetical protein
MICCPNFMGKLEERMPFFNGQYPKGGSRTIEGREKDIRFKARGANKNS